VKKELTDYTCHELIDGLFDGFVSNIPKTEKPIILLFSFGYYTNHEVLTAIKSKGCIKEE
jgi:hypothetical protein